MTEYERVPVETGALWWKKEVEVERRVGEGYDRSEASASAVPARLHLDPLAANDGLTRPGAGADLVDLVARADLGEELVDTLRSRSLSILDKATETLFNPEREVSEGRQSYDQLSNLERALKLAEVRFGEKSYYKESPLGEQIAKLGQVTPLFACVAMVPGEMSSSLKKHAKELYEVQFQSTSSSATRSREEGFSLSTGGYRKSSSTASQNSSSSGSLRKESFTTDERIMPVLHDLRMQLDQLQIREDGQGRSFLVIPGRDPQ